MAIELRTVAAFCWLGRAINFMPQPCEAVYTPKIVQRNPTIEQFKQSDRQKLTRAGQGTGDREPKELQQVRGAHLIVFSTKNAFVFS